MITSGDLFRHLGASLMRIGAGWIIGSIAGVIMGGLIGLSWLWRSAGLPFISALFPVPKIALLPLLILWCGIGETSKVLLIGLGSFCTLYLHTAHGIRGADRKLVEVAYVLGKSRSVLIRSVIFPAALPEIFAAARIAMALSWALLIVAEVIASSSGLGWFIWDARNFNRPSDMIVGMIVIGVLGKLSDALLGRVGHFVTRWRDTYGG